jgi:hypothetical protein
LYKLFDTIMNRRTQRWVDTGQPPKKPTVQCMSVAFFKSYRHQQETSMSSSDQSGFGKFVPGFEFMQNLARQATGGLAQGVQQAVPQLPSLGNWVAPTFNVEDLEKRIEELKAVHFWLDQNSRALAATIQALEVQKMTLSTLQGMNLSMGDVANALKVRATDTMASMAGFAGMGAKPDAPAAEAPAAPPATPTQFAGLEIPPRRGAPVAEAPAPEAAAPEPAATPSAAPSGGVVDPMQWWGALSQQFQTIASQAMKDAAGQATLEAGKQMANTLTREALKTATGMVAKTAAMATNPLKAVSQPGSAASAGGKAGGKAAGKPASKRGSGATTKQATAKSTARKVVAKAVKPVAVAAGKAAVKSVVKSVGRAASNTTGKRALAAKTATKSTTKASAGRTPARGRSR